MQRRHQVNHDMLLHGLPKKRKPAVIWGVSVAAAVALSGSIAIPIVAQPADSRSGNIPVSSEALVDPGLYNDPVYVSPDAPLNVFGASGKELDIDGRPLGMVADASDEEGDSNSSSEETSTLLAGEVGQIGELPGGLQLMHPVTSRRISSPYGWRSNPTGAGNQIHIGQDYPISCGSPVYASEAGTVTVSGWAGHSGMRVTISHGNNVQTGYSHNSKLIVKVGDQVKQGQLIALSGTTGNSTGCHVHFEVIVDGRWHDPRNYLPIIPGQRQAMIDSSRLTVNANSAPKGSGSNPPVRDHEDTSTNPDIVVPKDDTPVVPKPKPKPSTKPKPSESQSPSPSESTKPSESSSPDSSQSPSTSPSQKPDPSDSESTSPSAPPSESEDGKTTTPPSTGGPSKSPSPDGSSTAPTPEKSKSTSGTESTSKDTAPPKSSSTAPKTSSTSSAKESGSATSSSRTGSSPTSTATQMSGSATSTK